ncbi:M20/M25/M40 family metallo-hydrolase [Kordiimonas sp. SCSIO 12610]|uniref:M20/M25/M40 family metallo-hydrolase n=1 Tax=Kordiimonas sp. SCSIO 12610 TaxID=2829597 RepID=UPI00210BA328|nr:M20/M25/M40 family metallo-hydrolase [Kordiimonas sp. SCSIO 12610]UTW54464.1 M20/M25/M40 family metallo-hydrolase [Kordiimonas sp. SCSIO 12610]
MKLHIRHIVFICLGFLVVACSDNADKQAPKKPYVADFDRENAIRVLEHLSSDDMAGRQTGTEGNAKARAYIIEQLKSYGVGPVGDSFDHIFEFTRRQQDNSETRMTGVNILAKLEGSKPESDRKMIVASAHYDHVGVRGDEIFNGADDNASGVTGLFAVIEHFLKHPPENDIVFAFFDAEEMGLQGARALVSSNEALGSKPDFNINFDMLSRSDKNELYAAGSFHTPQLKPLLTKIGEQAPVKLMLGHDDPALGNDDWTLQSDHGPFHREGIPFLYFGVEDHPHYHRPSDEFETVPQDFFLRSIDTVVLASQLIDQSINEILE